MQSWITIGNPVLRIRDIDRVLAFYEKTVGLQVIRRYSAYDYDDDSDELIYEIGLKSVNSNQRVKAAIGLLSRYIHRQAQRSND